MYCNVKRDDRVIFNLRKLSACHAVQIYNLNMAKAKTLGTKVRIERATLGLSQAELAEKVGVSRGYISDIERDSGSINIGTNTMLALATALGVSAAYLLGITENPLAGIDDDEEQPAMLREAPAAHQAALLYAQEIVDLLPELSDARRYELWKLAETLVAIEHSQPSPLARLAEQIKTGKETPHVIGDKG